MTTGKKCWFVLGESHYPPPTIPKNSEEPSKGPLRWGHLVPHPDRLDHVINSSNGPTKFSPDMEIYPTSFHGFRKTHTEGTNVQMSTEIEAPVAVAAGLTANAKAGVRFKDSNGRTVEFESLDTHIVQVSQSYVNDSLREPEVAEYIRQRSTLGNWSVFMITGIAIARGPKFSRSKTGAKGGTVGMGIGIPQVATLDFDVDVSFEKETSTSSQSHSDFVWAVRFAKITKRAWLQTWRYETFSSGAVYGTEDDALGDIMKDLEYEGIRPENILVGGSDDEVFVLGNESSSGTAGARR